MPATSRSPLRILAEGAAIVLSILLAFAIDAAWDESVERREERTRLEGLRDEIATFAARSICAEPRVIRTA